MDPSLIIAFVLVGAAIIAFEFGISSAILEIVAGVVLAFFFVDLPKLEWLHFLANLGMLTLMFMVGFEVDVRRLRETWRVSVAVGVCALCMPAAGVFAIAVWLLDVSYQVAGLLAIGVSTTSLALVYQALREGGGLETAEGQTILAAASVIDVLSMIGLAFLMGDVGWGTAVFLLLAIFAAYTLPSMGKWVFRRYKGSLVELELRFLLVILISMGVMAEMIGGVHPALVAFGLGVIMSREMEDNRELDQKLKGIVFSLFAPVFFLQAGMFINLRAFTVELIGITALIFAVTCCLKYVGSALPYRLMTGRPGRIPGLLLNYQLSFGIITATVGLKTGLLSSDLYAVILMVVICSALIPAAILRQKPAEFR